MENSTEETPKKTNNSTTKKSDKKILSFLKKYTGTYTYKEFNNIVKEIHADVKEVVDYKKVRRIISKCVNIFDNEIKFDIINKSNMTYPQIKTILKSPNMTTTEEPTKVKTGGSVFKILISAQESECEENEEKEEQQQYMYPIEPSFTYKNIGIEPSGSQWVHDVQLDDHINDIVKVRTQKYNYLANLKYHKQRSDEWFAQRDKSITASDGGCAIGENHYEDEYMMIAKKLGWKPFGGNAACYHGKKLEDIATMIYEYRRNVIVNEFGLVTHPKYDFLAASPDGIIGPYKLDGKHLTSLTGRMLEIKCPTQRKIKTEGDVKGVICPIYYWVQVQLQLECCDLDECDFWQCKILEYEDREEFIEDTDYDEPFKSKRHGFEKGCLIQLLPKNKYKEFVSESDDGKKINIDHNKYNEIVYDYASFIYPPKIEMTPLDCDKWIAEQIGKLNDEKPECCFDRVIYWKIVESHCALIERDKKWFAETLPRLKTMWDYVLFFRGNPDKATILKRYIDSIPPKTRDKNGKVMNVVKILSSKPTTNNKKLDSEYAKKILVIEEEITANIKKTEDYYN